jgi:hypothetical protein
VKVRRANSQDPLSVTDADFDQLLCKMLLELVRCGTESELVHQLLDHGAPNCTDNSHVCFCFEKVSLFVAIVVNVSVLNVFRSASKNIETLNLKER